MRSSGFSAELIEHLFDKPAVFAFGLRPRGGAPAGQTGEERRSSARSDDPFSHAVLQLAALSLSARSILALRS
jgi:hypothetical protein